MLAMAKRIVAKTRARLAPTERVLLVRFPAAPGGVEKVCELIAPTEHRLDVFQASHPLYDRRFPLLTAVVSRHYPGANIVDVGANIGDTVALCRLAGCTSKIVAVEASARYFQLLERNLAANRALFGSVRCVNAFVGSATDSLRLEEAHGTAATRISALHEPRECSPDRNVTPVPTFTIGQVAGTNVSLVKIDTDGYDAHILRTELEWLHDRRPIVWAEAEVESNESLVAWLDVLARLDVDIYSSVIAFDNFGFVIAAGRLVDTRVLIEGLLRYIHRHAAADRAQFGAPPIYYLDIALFPSDAASVFDEYRRLLPELA